MKNLRRFSAVILLFGTPVLFAGCDAGNSQTPATSGSTEQGHDHDHEGHDHDHDGHDHEKDDSHDSGATE